MTAKARRIPTAAVVGILMSFTVLLLAPTGLAAPPDGQIAHAVPFALTPALFDPADHGGALTALLTFYALHDALVKPMPGGAMAPSLAESWSVTRDGLTYEFALRKNVRFHNGDSLTAEDVKFSFERYRGVSSKLLRDKVAAVEIVNSHRVRFTRAPAPLDRPQAAVELRRNFDGAGAPAPGVR